MASLQKNILFLSLLAISLLAACKKEDPEPDNPDPEPESRISAVDISSYPEIEAANTTYFDASGNPVDFLSTLQNSGVNTIRLRLWVDPATQHSGFEEVRQFAQRLRAMGFRIWLCLHYADTWADPGQQQTPARWQGLSLDVLRDSVRAYTEKVVSSIPADYIQIGNELNAGFLHPEGNRNTHPQGFLSLLETGIAVVRNQSPETRIMLHYAGYDGADDFFAALNSLDYDLFGLSYYPAWHGNKLQGLSQMMNSLNQTFDKRILIAETAYPFTLAWQDQTHNLVGDSSHLILPEYPATPQGQQAFLNRLKKMVFEEVSGGIGFCYWGAEWIAFKGSQATDGSPWENQALFDFDHRALPVLAAFRLD